MDICKKKLYIYIYYIYIYIIYIYIYIYIYVATLHISFHQFQHYIHLKIPIYNKHEKLIHEFILYTQETSYMKWKTNIAYWGVSMKINDENEKYILHFIFHTNILHIKFSWIL